jgi:hypothetical protein
VSDNEQNSMTVGCENIEQLAVLYACDELDPAVRAAVETHAAQCAGCSTVLSREIGLYRALASVEQPADTLDPSGMLLAKCRSELAEALDDRQAKSKQSAWRAILSPYSWWIGLRGALVYHPALSMAVLIVMGFFAGVAGQRSHNVPAVAPHAALTVSSAPALTDQELHSAASANVAWVTPSGTLAPPTVQVQLMAQTPMNIVGSPDDAEVQRALTFVLANGQQFDSGVRLDSLDVLRTRASDPQVLRAICSAARTDDNPGVRMKALETLQGFTQDALARGTVLDALQNDDNSGVRVQAINLLVDSLHADSQQASDPQILTVLRDRAKNDSNRYVRLQSASALRQLGFDPAP